MRAYGYLFVLLLALLIGCRTRWQGSERRVSATLAEQQKIQVVQDQAGPLLPPTSWITVGRGGRACSDTFSASIIGTSTGVRLPSGSAACSWNRSRLDLASCRQGSSADGADCKNRGSIRSRRARPLRRRRHAGRPPRTLRIAAILACSAFTSTGGVADLLPLPGPNSSDAAASSCPFQVVIWLGWISN
jgi:hypothetical protein